MIDDGGPEVHDDPTLEREGKESFCTARVAICVTGNSLSRQVPIYCKLVRFILQQTFRLCSHGNPFARRRNGFVVERLAGVDVVCIVVELKAKMLHLSVFHLAATSLIPAECCEQFFLLFLRDKLRKKPETFRQGNVLPRIFHWWSRCHKSQVERTRVTQTDLPIHF